MCMAAPTYLLGLPTYLGAWPTAVVMPTDTWLNAPPSLGAPIDTTVSPGLHVIVCKTRHTYT